MHRLKKHTCQALLVILLLINSTLGQTPQPVTQQNSSREDDAVVRITTNLVQVDVVVTDKNGKQVTDLKPEDFELREDGRSQKVTNFSYISTSPLDKPEIAPQPVMNAQPAPAKQVQLRPDQVSRTMALVVDDLGLSFESVQYVRQALNKFVEEQIQPGDLVAIIPTSGGSGIFQQFTSDKRQLQAAIKQIKWRLGREGVSAFVPINSNSDLLQNKNGPGKSESRSLEPDIDVLRDEFFSVGTLGALNQVILGLKELPGRKAVVLFSDGFQIYDPNRQDNHRVLEAIRRLTDLANRASVVTYTIDARGLQSLALKADDAVMDNSEATSPLSQFNESSGRLQQQVLSLLELRRDRYIGSQEGLRLISDSTGGFFSTDVLGGMKRVLNDQQGYYLIGYDPDESTFEAKEKKKLHKLSVKVKRPGLKVRSRGGFYGFTDEEARPVAKTRTEQLAYAISSPVASNGIGLKLTPIFLNDESQGPHLRTLLHIDINNLSFTEAEEGWRKYEFDVMAVTFGGEWNVVDQVGRNHTISVRGDKIDKVNKEGLLYVIDVPVKKAGAYQLRVAVRDSKTESVGSASQFVEVPDINKGDLTLSGIIANCSSVKDTDSEAKSNIVTPAVRKFRNGMMLNYSYYIYNARLNRSLSIPQLKTQVRLFRNGQEVYAGKVSVYDHAKQTDMKKLISGGRIFLGEELSPGEYALQVIVTDDLVTGKSGTTTQWIDFEIVE
jgi:VWFA-related protein